MDGQPSDDARVYQNQKEAVIVCYLRSLDDYCRIDYEWSQLPCRRTRQHPAMHVFSTSSFWKSCKLAFVINLAFWTSIG